VITSNAGGGDAGGDWVESDNAPVGAMTPYPSFGSWHQTAAFRFGRSSMCNAGDIWLAAIPLRERRRNCGGSEDYQLVH
jgi:hypothetical protein